MTMTGVDLAHLADPIIHDVGTRFLMDRATMARGKELGYRNPLSFYFAGRGGVLGDVDADVVTAAMGWFSPAMVRPMWERGVAVAGPREAARRYFEACADWGRDHLAAVEGLDRFATLAERVVSGAEGSGLPVFAGWRAEPRVPDVPGRAMQLIHVLREWRGAIHLVATTAAGLSPVAAIVTHEGEGVAPMFGWSDPPDCTDLKPNHDAAQETTDRLCALVYERVLADSERAEFADLAEGLRVAVGVPGSS